MVIISRISTIVWLCLMLGCLNAEEVFKHKDWSVKRYNADFIKYSTHGSAVWGHEFGFLKRVGDCKANNLYVSWSSSTNLDQLKRIKNKEVLFDLKPDDNFLFQYPIPNLIVTPLMGSEYLEIPNPLNIMLFTNYFPKYTFKPTLEVGRKISVEVNEKDPHHANFDIPYDEFSLEGYIAARQFALEQCEIKTKTKEIINKYNVTRR